MAGKGITLTKEQQQYIAFGVLALIGGGYTFFTYFWIPTSKKIAETKKKIVVVDGKINKAKAQAGRLKRIQMELDQLNEQAEAAEKRLPREQDLPSVIDTLSELSRKCNVDLSNFSPGGASAQAHFIEVPYQVSAKATYHDLGRFLASLALEERIFNVRNINYGTPGGSGVLTLSFTIVSYQYKG